MASELMPLATDADATEPVARSRSWRRGVSTVVGGAAVVALLWIVPQVLDDRLFVNYYFSNNQLLGISLTQVNLALVAVLGALALNLLVGTTGLVSLGHAAFFAVGTAAAALGGLEWGLPFPLTLLFAGLVGAAVGVLVGLPSLRLQGLYLMLATLALHYIAIYLFQKYQLSHFSPSGISFDTPSFFGWMVDTDSRWYWVLVVIVALTIVGIEGVKRSRTGRALIASRDHEVAAASVGMNVSRVRLTSFATSAFIVSVAGAAYAYLLGHVTSSGFGLSLVIGYFAMIILGGMGSTLGAVLGALVWTLFPAVLQTLTSGVDPATPVVGEAFTTYQSQAVSVIMGIAIILMLRFRPDGLAGLWTAFSGFVARTTTRSSR